MHNPNGTATATATNVSYLWSNGETSASISGLSAGVYTVTVTDLSTGCTATCTSNVASNTSNPLVTCSATDNTNCSGAGNGTAAATASGVSYQWSGGETTSSISGLSAGTYTVTVTDNTTGCTSTCEAVVGAANSTPSATCQLIQNNNQCIVFNGQCSVATNAGNPAYLWSDGQATSIAVGLAPGIYTVTVTDLNSSCSASCSVEILNTPLPVPTANCSATDNNSCTTPNGTASVTTSAVNPTYLWNNGDTNNSISNLSAGTYTVTVTDQANGCTASCEATVGSVSGAPIVNCSSTNNSACGNPNGTAQVSSSSISVTYLWSNGATTNQLSGLLAGSYTVTVTDTTNGCIGSCVSVIADNIFNLTATCSATDEVNCNAPNGTVQVTDNSNAATYFWSNGETTSGVSGLSAGVYTVTVTDIASGCTQTCSAEIFANYDNVTISLINTDSVICFGNPDGAFEVEGLTNGSNVGPYSYTIDGLNYQASGSFNGLFAGTYTVGVYDSSNGCASTIVVDIYEPNPLEILISDVINIECYNDATGSINITPGGGTPPYTFLWSNGMTTEDLSNLVASLYTVTITDNNNCEFISAYDVFESPSYLIGLQNCCTSVSCFGASDGTAYVDVQGATPFSYGYIYQWNTNPIQTTALATGLSAGTWTITITDSLGCDTTLSVFVAEPNLLVAIPTVDQITCSGGNDGSISLSILGGVPFTSGSPYSVTWNTVPVQTTSSISGLSPGIYTATVTDSLGCNKYIVVTITEPDLIFVSMIGTDISCFGDDDGDATVDPVGGVGPYTYLWSNGQTTQIATNLLAGTYTVTVTDFNGCTVSSSITLNQPDEIVATYTVVDVSCPGAKDGKVLQTSLLGGSGPFTYLWNSAPAQTTASLINVNGGTYSVFIFDASGCSTSLTYTVNDPLPILCNGVMIPATCLNSNNGSIVLNPSGGSAPYSFLWSNGATSSSNLNLAPGIYTVTITDDKNCTTSCSYTVLQISGLSVTLQAFNISCNGAGNGSIISNVSGGISPYTYLWSNSSTNANLSNLQAGIYTLTVTDLNGCTGSSSVSITQPVALSCICNASVQNVTCFGGNNGSIMAQPIGGTPPYSYVWSNGQSTQAIGGLVGGNYTVTITDANGCIKVGVATVSQPTQLFAIIGCVQNVSCNGNNNGSACVSGIGGTPPYTYSWNTVPGQTTSIATGLSSGTYIATVTDVNGCTATSMVTITQPTAVVGCSINHTNISCFGSNNGTAQAVPSGGTSPYSYLWSNGSTTKTILNLASGVYTVTISDNNGCSSSCSVTIIQPPALATLYIVTKPSCNGGNNGSVDVTVTGGVAPYSYLWSTGATTQDVNGLNAGAYTLTITDANGCNLTANIFVGQPNVLNCSMTKTNVKCGGASTGSATVTASGGTPPYAYLWSNGKTIASNPGIPAGTYTVTITDANGCAKQCFVTITQPAILTCNVNVITNAGCNNNNGKAQVVATGGTAPYTYLWSTSPIQTNAIASGLGSGVYFVIVTDNKGCTTSCSVTIPSSNALSCGVFGTNVSCNGLADGTATVTVNGGSSPYTYVWNTSSASTTSSVSGLSAGTYTVTVTDNTGCTTSCLIVIVEPGLLSCTVTGFPIDCNGGNNGSATVNVSGGVGPYTYLWSNGNTTNAITALSAGTYSVTVTDVNNCSTSCSTTIITVTPIVCQIVGTDVSCNGGSDGTATVSASGGSGTLLFTWSTVPVQNAATATGLSAGTYSVTVTDANGCSSTCTIQINEPVLLECNAGVTNNISCFGGNDGEAEVVASGGTPGYTYIWSTSPVQTTAIATGLSSGNYIVIVTDANGCTTSCTVTLGQGSPLTCVALGTNTTCGQDNGSATVNVSGGTGGYTYLWSNGETTSTISNLPSGNYTVTVTDQNGCTTSCNTGINASSSLILIINKSNTNCNGTCTGTATVVSVAGGVAPYTYLWSNGQTTKTASSLCAGIAMVTVTDATGCESTASVTISQPPPLNVDIIKLNDVYCNGGTSGSAVATVSGGNSPFQFLWSNGATTQAVLNFAAGTYTVTVTDNKGCSGTASVTFTQPTLLTSSVSSANAACNGSATGSATVTASGGVTPYTYQWTTSPVQTTATASALPAGTYFVTVTDSNGCTSTASVIITQPPALICGITPVNPGCNNANSGSATVIVTGGTGSYTYLWNTGATTSSISGLGAGAYTVAVTDANGCSTTCQTILSNPAGLSVSTGVNPVTCNGLTNGTATAQASGGSSPYTYLWSNGQTTQTISGLAPGTYTVAATDANGCEASAIAVITEPTILSVITNSGNSTCGNSNGSAIAVASGGTPGYTFIWSNGQNGSAIGGLIAGTYTVTVTDANGCTVSTSVTIGSTASLQITITPTDILCYGASTGMAVANVTGGSGTYTYLWNTNPAQTTAFAIGIEAGTYTVFVDDNNGCTGSASVTITEPLPVECTTSSTKASCNGACDATAAVVATGGTGSYSYNWNTIPTQTTAIATGLCAGIYQVIVTDANGCSSTCSVTVGGSPLLTCSIAKLQFVKCGLPTGKLQAVAIGGTSPYTYLWNTGTTTKNLNNILGGTYTVTITDANGCTTSCYYDLKNHGPVDCFVTTIPSTCGGCNGQATVLASGGGLIFKYLWSNGKTTKTIKNLCAGTYIVTVSDQFNCTKTCQAVIVTNNNLSCTVSGSNIQCNGGSNGFASVSAVGGNGTYTYLWTTGATTQLVTGLTAGTYTVTVTSGGNCSTTCSIVLTKPGPLLCDITPSDASCGQCNGSGILNVTGGTPPYTYQWSNGITTSIATGLCSGSYSALVTDANGCSTACSVTINSVGSISCNASATNVLCNGGTNGTATVAAVGAGSYVYLWSNGQTTVTATGLAAGTYTVTVSAGIGCSTTCSVLVTQPAQLMCNITSTTSSCGQCNGTASVVANGGTPGYTYLWNNGATTSSTASLCAGSYTVTVTDSNGCTTICNINVGTSNNISCIITKTNVKCNGGNNGTATVNPTGGSGYTYLWSNGQTTKTATGLSAGVYTATVTSSSGCTTTCTVNITQPQALSCTITPTDASCGLCNGAVIVSASGGKAPYTYIWSNGATTKDLTAVCAGTYTITITDANGCTRTCSAVVNSSNGITCTISKTNVSCFGGNNGTATVNATGGSAYTYLWSNGQTSQTATGLVTGTYEVTVTSGAGCTTTCSVNIFSPLPLSCQATSTSSPCGQCIGTAVASGADGVAPYSFLWSNSATTASISNLCAGTYTVTVTDANGCTSSCITVVSGAGTIGCSIISTPITCHNGSNGTATANGSGGINYTYLWSTGASSQSIANLAAGTYTVTISAGNCTSTCSVVLNNPNLLTCNVFVTATSCGSNCTGTVSATVNGGVAPYTYQWNNGATTSSLNNVCAATYTVVITDSRGCTTSCSGTVSGGTGISCTTAKTNVSCNGGNNGTATVNATGGSGYTYLWSNAQTNQTATSLIAGTYTVTVTASNGCSTTCTAVITQPTVLSCSISGSNATCGACNGSATVSATGGTGTKTFVWSNGSTTATISSLCAGTYIATVTDIRGCTSTCSIVITATSSIACTTTKTNVSCNGGNNGTATVNATGGSGYTYLWSNAQTNQTATGLIAGTYTVTVTASNGCTTTCTAVITQPTALSCSISGSNATCGACNGSATVSATGGTGTKTFVWSNGSTTATISSLCAGTYIATVTDANGCTSTCSIVITATSSITCTTTKTNVSCNGGNNGTATVNATGGSGYTYLWSNAQTNQTATGLIAGTYTVTVTASNGCTTTCTAVITQPTALSCSISGSNATCGACNGSATVSATGGTGTKTLYGAWINHGNNFKFLRYLYCYRDRCQRMYINLRIG
ncbi:MAG: SprB repeat-containing protein [Bacteroidetes bacterium]|nr:SprB repeat-containing protein [Bacteroidota bacterium]